MRRRVIVGPRRQRLAAVVLVVVLLGAACTKGGKPSESPGAVKEGGVLRIGTTLMIDSLNPYVAIADNPWNVFEQIYPYLVQYDDQMKLVGDFATSWETSPDGLAWTFHTVPDAKWSDGQPLTAEDAAWTINTNLKYEKGPTGAAAGWLTHVTGAETPDPNTLVVRYERPVGNVLAQMQLMPILPEHVWSQYATGDGKAIRTFPNYPPIVSGGAFAMTKYVKDEIALFDRNPNFYGPAPHIGGFGLKFFGNDDAMITALKAGEIDAVQALPPTAVQAVKGAGFVVMQAPGIAWRDLIINSNPKKPQNRELLDPQVRLAFAHAIDRQRIVEVAWLGYGVPGDSIVSPASGIWHDPSLKPETYDPALANQILDQAGYPRGPDGIRIAGGHPMDYTVIFASDEKGPGDRAFQIIQSNFAEIGVKLSQRTLDSNATWDAIIAPGGKYLDFDLAMWDWVPPIDPDFVLSVMTCASYGDWNDSGYCNPEYDKLYEQQGVAVDQQKRLEIVYEMQKIVYEDRPYIVLNYNEAIDAHSKQWDGFVMSPQGSFNPYSKYSLLQVHRV